MTHFALRSTAHRPWPVPARPWSLTMRWEDLLFLHWPIDAGQLRPLLPPRLQLDTYDGYAWLGVVPFTMAKTRFRRLPIVPTAHRFPECNLRTYVRVGERTGVWFFSLDAASRLAVEGARLGFGLPYFRARMRSEHVADNRCRYDSERIDRRAPAATFRATYDLASSDAAPAVAGTLEHFLVERYCLFALRRGHLVCGEIAHEPWRLSPARVDLEACDMARLVGAELVDAPVSVLAAQPIEVAAWSPVRC